MSLDVMALIEALNENTEAKQQLIAALGATTEPEKPPSRFEAKPFPEISSLTLLQATFFNNGPKEKRKRNSQEFAVTIEAWTKPADQIKLGVWQWKASIALLNYIEAGKRINSLLAKESISQEYHEHLKRVIDALLPRATGPQPYFGLISSKFPGTVYHENQFVVAQIEHKLPTTIQVLNGADDVFIERFASTDMKGQPLKGSAVRQARIDLSGEFYSNWPT